MIALGGGVASAGAFITDQVGAAGRCCARRWCRRGSTTIVTATLGNDAGAIGAATMALQGGLAA